MKFSIVITTYNRLELLQRAVKSALAQALPAEVVVVDNASSDGTEAYLRHLGNQVVYYRNTTNTSHAGAVNAGAKVATGDWIKLVDDDDYLAPHCLETMAAAIAHHPEAVICSGQAAQVNPQGEALSRTPPTGPGQAFYIPQEAIHYGMLLEAVPFGTPIQVAVRRDALLNSGGWDLAMTSCDDIDSWIRVADYGDALFINQCLAYRTQWPGGYDQKIPLPQRLATNIVIKERIYQHLPPAYRAQAPQLDVIRAYLHLHWSLVALKQRRLGMALQLGWPAALSPQAWRLLRQARRWRQSPASPSCVPKHVVLD
ncbi:putative glycosyltransferase YwdF [Halomicronema hongdechloris C2206]|uniref:Glycosyltransferase YwdF n=1 Tax=Halomicronema hongdechloris C2206 TaxID=1641165 RepID=A0A1Z3HFU4_9CYAN|nr:glycosyltransferase family 2 protein [Halomicronema hongdechloris]ASC69152.1 putative glycosyltransferase YwdF [Halomicronema hongdechloris C2206]